MSASARFPVPGWAALALCLAACAAPGFRDTAPGFREAAPGPVSGTPSPFSPDGRNPRFQIVYVIHGDAGYGYHDEKGSRHLADTAAVAKAIDVARNTPRSEVFIFHQKPRRSRLFRSGPDGYFHHFRDGRLLAKQSYSRGAMGSDFAAEADWYRRLASPSGPRACGEAGETQAANQPESRRFFAYFGHEIPEQGGRGYSRSHPREAFSLTEFTRGLERFSAGGCPGEKPFSIVVLSTCYGGTPAITAALSPYADYLVASPGNLHLTFLDTRAFKVLPSEDSDPFGSLEARDLASVMAGESFDRLRETTRTEITVALYEMDKSAAYLRCLPGRQGLPASRSAKRTGTQPGGFRDCAENPAFGPGGEQAGVEVYYRPPQFGALKGKQTHSGWECPGPGSLATGPETNLQADSPALP